jgi:hypothetical protein
MPKGIKNPIKKPVKKPKEKPVFVIEERVVVMTFD